MKTTGSKIAKYMLPALVASIMVTGCSKDDTSDADSGPAKREFKVLVSNRLGEDDTQPSSRTTFTDGEGLAWEEGDHAYFGYVSGSGRRIDGSGIEIGADGFATFTFPTIPASSNVWFIYSATYNFGSDKNECTVKASQIQDAPGSIGRESLILKSDLLAVDAATGTATPKMKLVGTLQRFLIYSKSGKYADESVQSVKMTSADNIAGLFGYNGKGQPVNGGGVNDPASVMAEETLYWAQSKTIATVVTNPAPVTATSRGQTRGRGIYMTIAPVTVPAGYTYVITTDQAVYTLTGPADKKFASGQVANIFVDLESAAVKRVGYDELTLRYAGNLGDSYPVSYEAAQNKGLGYWYAVVNDGTSDTTHASFPADAKFYAPENVTFTVTDNATGQPATWLSCKYRENDTWWDVTYEANMETDPRTAVITATYNVPGYNCTTPTKVVRVTQKGFKATSELTYVNYRTFLNVDAAGVQEYKPWWFHAVVDGTDVTRGQNPDLYAGLVYDCGDDASWLTASDDTGDWFMFSAGENTSKGFRTGIVNIRYEGTTERLVYENPVMRIHITQAPANDVKHVRFFQEMGNGGLHIKMGKAGGSSTTWISAYPYENGVQGTRFGDGEEIYSTLSFTCTDSQGKPVDWIQDIRMQRNNVVFSCTENTTGKTRMAYLSMQAGTLPQDFIAASPCLTYTIQQAGE